MRNSRRKPPHIARTVAAGLSLVALACADTRAPPPLPATPDAPAHEAPRDPSRVARMRTRGPSTLRPFVWPAHTERYEADLASGEALVLAMIPTTGLVMLGELRGAEPRHVAFDPVGVVFYVFGADGRVIRNRVVDMGAEIGNTFAGGTRAATVHVSAFDEDLSAHVRWDVTTDVVTPIRAADDEANGALEEIVPCVFDGTYVTPDCAAEVFPDVASRPQFGGYLRPRDAFTDGGDAFASTEAGLVEIHDGHVDFTRCRQRAVQVVADDFGVRSIALDSVCDAERGVLARGAIEAVSANGRFVLLRHGAHLNDASPPEHYVLHDAATGARDLGALALRLDFHYFSTSEPLGYRPFLDDRGRYLVLAPSGMLLADVPIVVVDLTTGVRTTQTIPEAAEHDDPADCIRAPLQVGDDVFTGGCGRPAYSVSLATGVIAPVQTRPPGRFGSLPRLLGDAATHTLRTDGLELHHGATALSLVRVPYYGEDRIAIIERRGAHVVIDPIVSVAKFSSRTGSTTALWAP